ncbi:type II toxin-antitoxin system RelE/ParE family toxin [Rhizobium sp.]
MAAIKPFGLAWSSAARADMRGMYRHILAETRNAAIPDRFITDLESKMRSLAASRISGTPRDDILEGLRSFPYRERCFYFRIEHDELIVLRVLHGRQDVSPEHFKKA